MQSAEIELKFPVGDAAALEAKLPALGFHLLTPRTFEHNVLFDTSDRSLRSRQEILRLRKYGARCVLTHKRPPQGADDSQYKTRIETETEIHDCDAIREILSQLGYEEVFTYDKFRTEWEFPSETVGQGRHLVLDETPIGTWVELEGSTDWIDRIREALEIAPSSCTTDSYGRLFESWKRDLGNTATSMTFEAVRDAGVPVLTAS
ncbi:MAG: class IV adenylate cyclase [Rhodospirillales bacterium]|nr:class IV adenylate cyclase [Acetobacter sp.]